MKIKKNCFLFAIGLTFLVGCSSQSEKKNEKITPKYRAQIKLLNDKIIEALNQNDPKELEEVFSEELKKKSGKEMVAFVDKVHTSFNTKKYSILDEYLVNNSATNYTAVTNVSEKYNYLLNYPVLTKDTYISLLLDNGKGNKHLITCIYGKYGDDWKLNILKIGDYSYFGKTAIDFYEQAKSNYKKGNLIDAAMDVIMLKRTASPADKIFEYKDVQEMEGFAQKVMAEANRKFILPKQITDIKTEPQILSVTPQPMAEGIFPMVTYLSRINLKDTVALRKENEELKKIIGDVIPGIEKEKKYVFFQAYNQIPNGKELTESFGFVFTAQQ